jgi:signal recognition particle subunit SRP54
MAFENLSERLQNAIKMFRGSGKITEDDLKAPLREVRMALLEADVNFKVVKDFVANIKERALGETVQQSLTPGQQIIKIVNDELTQLLGGTQSKLTVADKPPTVIMLVGLQGAGKTTTAGKLGSLLRKKGKKPLLVAGDVYRPAAIKQLQVLGEQLSLPVFALGDQVSPVEIARKAMDKAFSLACDTVIIDTAGRLHINEELMDELRNIKAAVNPHEILLVVDAMTGQDAVTVAESFNGELGIDGLIVTKLDGDARGGAVLSVKAVTGRPVKFVGMGEKLDALEPFHPDRMASRILGMGDILSLIEKIQSTTDLAKALEMEKKLRKDEFTLEQFLEQMQQVKKMGSLETILGLIPGMSGISQKLKEANVDEKEFDRVEAIIRSMTPKERRHPDIINGRPAVNVSPQAAVCACRMSTSFSKTLKKAKR